MLKLKQILRQHEKNRKNRHATIQATNAVMHRQIKHSLQDFLSYAVNLYTHFLSFCTRFVS